ELALRLFQAIEDFYKESEDRATTRQFISAFWLLMNKTFFSINWRKNAAVGLEPDYRVVNRLHSIMERIIDELVVSPLLQETLKDEHYKNFFIKYIPTFFTHSAVKLYDIPDAPVGLKYEKLIPKGVDY